MARSYKGKFFLLYLVLLLYFPSISWCVLAETNLVITENESKHHPDIVAALDVLKKHEVQLEKLEELVKNLAELLSRLDSQFSDFTKVKSLIDKEQEITVQERVEFDDRIKGKGDVDLERNVKDGERAGAMSGSAPKFSGQFWAERFHFVSAVKLGSNPTCIDVLPFTDFDGLSKFVVVGDEMGRIYVLSINGDVLVELYTMSKSPVTAVVSYLSVYKNESIVVTGHGNGVILMHRVWEDSNGDEWNSLRMESVVKFDEPESGDGLSSITVLVVHHVGRKRYILSVDFSGRIRVFRENGTVYGDVRPSSRPLAFLKQRLLFLTESGAGSLDLRTMKIRESQCEGLNNSVVKSYVIDATERSKAYGITSEGDLIHVLLLGDIMNFKCRIRSKRKFDMAEPLAFEAIKGYLLIANQEKVFVYNVSSQHYVRAGGPKLLFSTDLNAITSFLNQGQMNTDDKSRLGRPVVASDHEKLVILSLGSGCVGMYRSSLPVFKSEFNTMQWTSPVLFFILFLFGAWHFFANKKEALIAWGPDDPFSSTAISNGARLGSGSGDLSSFTDSSRNAEVMDLKGSNIRAPSRRYVSPSQYPGGSGISYRPPADANSVSASVDPNFRTNQELKYRGSNLENTGFPRRRDNGLFVNSPVVDDKS